MGDYMKTKIIESLSNPSNLNPNGWLDLIFDGEDGGTGKTFTKEQGKAFTEIKNAAKNFAKVITKHTPSGYGTVSVRLVREALYATGHALSSEANA
jgi:hypothetical protein